MKVLITMEPVYTQEVGNAITSQVLEFNTKRSDDITHHMDVLVMHFRERGVAVIWKILPDI
nr:hypothetical protein ART_00083 [Achromobacter phage vB_Ade_ART]